MCNIFISEQIKSGNFEKSIYFKTDCVKSKTDSETYSAKRKLEYRNGTRNVQFLKRNTGTELYEQDNGN